MRLCSPLMKRPRPESRVQARPRAQRMRALVRQIGGFLVVGAICTAASLALYASLRPSVGVQWANAISLIVTSLLNTELNRRLSWNIQSRRMWVRDHLKGLLVMLLALALTSSSLWLLHAIVRQPSLAVEVITITAANVLAALTRFLLLRHWIFRRQKEG